MSFFNRNRPEYIESVLNPKQPTEIATDVEFEAYVEPEKNVDEEMDDEVEFQKLTKDDEGLEDKEDEFNVDME